MYVHSTTVKSFCLALEGLPDTESYDRGGGKSVRKEGRGKEGRERETEECS